MDSRITKKRLSDFLAYEWIFIIFLCVVAIVVWELVYTVSAVRLTPGQDYKFFYDKNVYYGDNYSELMNELGDDTFSFDVQKIHAEEVMADNDVMYLRLSVQEGDMLFTDCKEPAEDATDKSVLAKTRVDAYDIPICNYEKLLSDAKNYLTELLNQGVNIDSALDELSAVEGLSGEQYDAKLNELFVKNFSADAISAGFKKRLGADNRFRTEAQKAEGLKLESGRIERLYKEVYDFRKLMDLDDEYFFTYTKYEQSLTLEKAKENPNQTNLDNYQSYYDNEVTQGRENARYGLRVEMLKKKTAEGKKDPTTFFRIKSSEDAASAKDVIIMVFDFEKYQHELQYESITVINKIVKACSTILD